LKLLFIAGFVTAAFPALFLGVNNGATVLGVLLMAFSGFKLLRGAR
jgi:hypothetical protein